MYIHINTLSPCTPASNFALQRRLARPGRTSVASPARNAVRSRTISTARPSIAELKTVVRGPSPKDQSNPKKICGVSP